MAEKLTPYQGKRRCFGHFYCENCEKNWSSAYSWANKGQECVECEEMIYPHKQHKLKWKINENRKKPHLQEYCEKCMELKHSCTKLTH